MAASSSFGPVALLDVAVGDLGRAGGAGVGDGERRDRGRAAAGSSATNDFGRNEGDVRAGRR